MLAHPNAKIRRDASCVSTKIGRLLRCLKLRMILAQTTRVYHGYKLAGEVRQGIECSKLILCNNWVRSGAKVASGARGTYVKATALREAHLPFQDICLLEKRQEYQGFTV